MAPEISAHLLWMNIRRQGQLSPIFQSAREEIRILHRRREHAWLAVHKRHVCVLHALADAPPREENRHRMTRRVDAGIREDVGAVVRLVRAVHDEIEFAISIEIHRQRKRPQPHAEIHSEPGVFVFQPLQSVRTNAVHRGYREQHNQRERRGQPVATTPSSQPPEAPSRIVRTGRTGSGTPLSHTSFWLLVFMEENWDVTMRCDASHARRSVPHTFTRMPSARANAAFENMHSSAAFASFA